MNKPISKHALRRAIDKVSAEGHMELRGPSGAVVDRIWHEMEKAAYTGGKKKPALRGAERLDADEPLEVDLT